MNLALALKERPPAIGYNLVEWREVVPNNQRAMRSNEVYQLVRGTNTPIICIITH